MAPEQAEQPEHRRRLLTATLWRDAAALSIILGDFQGAQALLLKSASAYLKESVLYGLMLARLGGDLRPWRTHAQSLGRLRRHLNENNPEADVIPQDISPPHVPQSDLVAVLQALAAAPATTWTSDSPHDLGDRWLFEQVIGAVHNQPGVQDDVAPNAIYTKSLLDLASREFSEAVPKVSPRYLTALATAREAELFVAKKDTFNWSLMPNPAEVVDFDLIILTMAMIEQGVDGKVVDSAFKASDRSVALPVKAARALHNLSVAK